MCHSSTLWPCPALRSSPELFLVEDKENQSTVQLDASFTSTMPPLHSTKPAALDPGLLRNPFVILPSLCLLVVISILAAIKWKNAGRNGTFPTIQRMKQDKEEDVKLRHHTKPIDALYSDICASQPILYFPPPPGSVVATESHAGQINLVHGNSGTLAAQAMAKRWPDPSLILETGIAHPWRRHSDPLSKAARDDGTNILITRDTDQYFDDADLNGFWRRRTLEFG
jgi:hypothetical protein